MLLLLISLASLELVLEPMAPSSVVYDMRHGVILYNFLTIF